MKTLIKKRLFLFGIFFYSLIGLHAQENTSGLLERNQIEEKFKWDIRDVYTDAQDWGNDIKWIEQNLNQYDKYRGKLKLSANNLLECLQFDNKINQKFGYIHLYAKMQRDVDMKNNTFQQMWSRCSVLETQIAVANSFIKPEIISIPEKNLQSYLSNVPELEIYKHHFKRLRNKKEHTLTNEKEEELSKISKLVDNPYAVFGSLVYSELPFPIIKDDKGNDLQLNRSTSWRARSSLTRDFRKKGYEEYYKTLGKFSGTLTQNLNGLIEGKVYLAQSRSYNNALEASLGRNDIPVQIYHNLIKSVESNLQPYHRWLKMKKQILGVDTLFIYDTRVSLFAEIQKEYTWEEAEKLVYESLGKLGEEYLIDIKNAYNNRWIDAFPNVGKETGGYSSGPIGPHPFVKMNWGGQLLDFYTLVHELGHYVHSSKFMKTQAYIYQNYPPFTSEIASTTAENISQFYLIENAQSKEEKLYQIEKYIDNVALFIYNSALMAEFELHLYETVENGIPLSINELCEFYGKLLTKYYGDDVFITETDKYSWLEWPHYYLDFYLYSYATSFAAAVQIASDIYTGGQIELERFITFLESGSSDYPVDLVKNAGVDLTVSDPYNIVALRMNDLIDKIECIMTSSETKIH